MYITLATAASILRCIVSSLTSYQKNMWSFPEMNYDRSHIQNECEFNSCLHAQYPTYCSASVFIIAEKVKAWTFEDRSSDGMSVQQKYFFTLDLKRMYTSTETLLSVADCIEILCSEV